MRELFTIITFQLHSNSGFLGVGALHGHEVHIDSQITLKISYNFFIFDHVRDLINNCQGQLYFVMCFSYIYIYKTYISVVNKNFHHHHHHPSVRLEPLKQLIILPLPTSIELSSKSRQYLFAIL